MTTKQTALPIPKHLEPYFTEKDRKFWEFLFAGEIAEVVNEQTMKYRLFFIEYSWVCFELLDVDAKEWKEWMDDESEEKPFGMFIWWWWCKLQPTMWKLVDCKARIYSDGEEQRNAKLKTAQWGMLFAVAVWAGVEDLDTFANSLGAKTCEEAVEKNLQEALVFFLSLINLCLGITIELDYDGYVHDFKLTKRDRYRLVAAARVYSAVGKLEPLALEAAYKADRREYELRSRFDDDDKLRRYSEQCLFTQLARDGNLVSEGSIDSTLLMYLIYSCAQFRDKCKEALFHTQDAWIAIYRVLHDRGFDIASSRESFCSYMARHEGKLYFIAMAMKLSKGINIKGLDGKWSDTKTNSPLGDGRGTRPLYTKLRNTPWRKWHEVEPDPNEKSSILRNFEHLKELATRFDALIDRFMMPGADYLELLAESIS